MKRITVFASIGCQNLGDECILKNEISLLREEFGEDTTFFVASYDPQNPVFDMAHTQYFEYFPIATKKLKNIPRNIKNFYKALYFTVRSDYVVIGGGGILYEEEVQSSSKALDQWLMRVRIARFFRKNIYFHSIGVNISSDRGLQKLKKICRGAYKISLRDQKSYETLRKAGVENEASLVDDPVFFDKLAQTERGNMLGHFMARDFRVSDLDMYEFQGRTIGLALRAGYIGKTRNAKIEILLIEELCGYIEKKGGKIMFLPHSFHQDDILANDYIFMDQFVSAGRETKESLQEVYKVYTEKQVDLIFSMRLHSMILASVYGIDQIALSYSQKTDECIKKIKKET